MRASYVCGFCRRSQLTSVLLLSTVVATLSMLAANNASAATTISVNFQGRLGSSASDTKLSKTNGPVPGLAATDIAGAVPSTNWNNIDNAYGKTNVATFVAANQGTTTPLLDSTGEATPVTLTFNADDSWNNDTDISTNVSANAKMMKGIIKMGNGHTNEVAHFAFNNVPDGQYDLYVYTDSNNDGVAVNTTDNTGLHTFYTYGTHQFLDTNTFIQARNTNPSGPRDTGNYVKFSKLATYGTGTLGFSQTYVSGGDGLGIAGLQLVEVGGPVPPRLLDFEFNEGQGPVTYDLVSSLPGVFGQALDPAHLTATSTNSPSGATNDLALSLNLGVTNRIQALVVDDRVSPALAFATNQAFTIETWINIDPSDTNTFEGLVAYGRTAASNVGYKLGLNQQQLLFTLFGVVDIPSGIFPTKGEWHHVAAVWKPGTGAEFFLDGTSVTNVANTQAVKSYATNLLTIGAESLAATNFANTFQGMMDRVRIHKAALTASQLDSVAATKKATLSSTIVAYNFDEGMVPFKNAASASRPAVSSTPNTWPTWSVNTPSGMVNDYALQFARGQVVEVPNPTNAVQLDTNNPSFTIQAWVNYPGNATNRMVLYYNNGPGGSLSFSIETNRTVFVTTLGVKDQDSKAKIPDDGHWHHIAAVHENNKEFRFYVDGALADTQAYTGGVKFTGTNQLFYIGQDANPGYQYVGLLDRLKLTKGILTPDQFDYPAGAVPPSVVSVGTLDGGVAVLFNVAVAPTTGTNIANYTVTGTTVTNATLIAPNYVLLGVSSAPPSGFSVTVQNLAGLGGDVMPAPITVTSPPKPGATIADGLVAYWNFDGHFADSIDHFDGAPRGTGAVQFVEGPAPDFGKAMKLTGTNYVEIPGSSNTLQFANGSLSIAGWFKVDTFDQNWQALISKGENSNYRVARRGSENTIAYAGGASEGPDDTPNINDGKWHHFVAVTDATAAEFGTALYVDGVIHSVQTNKPSLVAGVSNLLIGENPEARGRNWKGEIDEIGLWNRVLVEEEVAMLYNGGQGTPLSTLAGVTPRVPAIRPYTIGLNFGADYVTNAAIQNYQVAGVPGVAQANWNNLNGKSGTNVTGIVADTDYETPTNTTVAVSWNSNNTWGAGGNDKFPGADNILFAGYLDTAAPSTTLVTITNVPPELTSSGYDVYIYALGDVSQRGGAYRILDATTQQPVKDYVRVQSTTNVSSYVEAPINPASTNYAVGNYLVFTGVTNSAITVEATTDHGYGFGTTHRAPIDAIQLVGVSAPPGPSLSIERTATGLSITFEGTLEETGDIVKGPWTAVQGTSPLLVQPTEKVKFYRAKQ